MADHRLRSATPLLAGAARGPQAEPSCSLPRRNRPLCALAPAEELPFPSPSSTRGSPFRIAGPFFLPDGKHFLYLFVAARDPGTDAVYYASVDGRENRRLVASQSNAVYADGFLLFMRGGQLMAQ